MFFPGQAGCEEKQESGSSSESEYVLQVPILQVGDICSLSSYITLTGRGYVFSKFLCYR